MKVDAGALIPLILLFLLAGWSAVLLVRGLETLARANPELRTLTGLTLVYPLESFVTSLVLLGYFLALAGWIPWPTSQWQNIFVLLAFVTLLCAVLTPLFFTRWSAPELENLYQVVRRAALARGVLIASLIGLGFGVVVVAYALLAQPSGLLGQVLNWGAVAALLWAVWLSARGLLTVGGVLEQLSRLARV